MIGLGNLYNLLRSIDGSKWMGKLLKVFCFGDYELLSKAISIAGANGKYPCISCLIDRDLMQIPRHLREKSVPRTMSLVNKDYKQFKRDGAIRKNQSKYHNVINKPLITCIDIERFLLPCLHILLGIIKKTL